MKKELKLYRLNQKGQGETLFIATPEQVEQNMKGDSAWKEALEILPVSLSTIIELRNVFGSTISGRNPLQNPKDAREGMI